MDATAGTAHDRGCEGAPDASLWELQSLVSNAPVMMPARAAPAMASASNRLQPDPGRAGKSTWACRLSFPIAIIAVAGGLRCGGAGGGSSVWRRRWSSFRRSDPLPAGPFWWRTGPGGQLRAVGPSWSCGLQEAARSGAFRRAVVPRGSGWGESAAEWGAGNYWRQHGGEGLGGRLGVDQRPIQPPIGVD